MRHFLPKMLFGAGCLWLAAASTQSAWADHDGERGQRWQRGDDDDDGDYRGGWQRGRGSGGPYDDSWTRGGYGAGLLGRVMNHLESARSYRYVDHHERKHFEQAARDLDRFQQNWSRGRFDRSRLDGAIENIQHLVNSNQVNPRDRQVLAQDLYALRDFRAGRGWGGNGRWDGYGR